MPFKQAFRIAFVTLVWRQYKAAIVSTLLLIGYFFLVSNLHSDYLTNAKFLGDNINTGVSFVLKWVAYLVGLAVYVFFHVFRGRRLTKGDKKKVMDSELKSMANTDEDPFSAIRARKKLRSRADFLSEEKK